jgi:hypothetical protein
MAEFERRLARARLASREQYLLAKADTLFRSGDERALRIVIGLLERVIAEWPEPVQLRLGAHIAVPRAHQLLARIYVGRDDLDGAEAHLRLCLAKADANRNGVGIMPAVFLAEVLIKKAGKENLEESERLLNHVAGEKRGLLWSVEFFRYFVARARLAKLQGVDPSEWAQRALETAADTRPQAPRHPTVGIVHADDAMIAELKDLIGEHSKRWA